MVKLMGFGYKNTFQLIDKGNIEIFGPSGTALNLQSFAKFLAVIQSGFASNYALFMILALLAQIFVCFSILNVESILSGSVLFFCYIFFCAKDL